MAAFDDIDLSIDELDDDFNSTFDSTDDSTETESDLEKYGVWVKTGPEDVIESKESEDDFTLEDLDVEDTSDSGGK